MYKSAIIVGSALLSVASAFEGDGTFYGAGGNGAQGACMMQPGSTGIGVTVAMNDAQYPGSCGKCVRITGDGRGTGGPGSTPVFGPVYAVVDNHCPECKYGDIDFGLSGDGRWRIYWDWVSCDEARAAQSNVPQPINYGVNTWGIGNQATQGGGAPAHAPQGQQGQGRQGGWWGWWQQLYKNMGERLHLRGTKPTAPTNLAADGEYRPRAEPPAEPLVLKPGFMVMKDGSFKKISEVNEGMEQQGKANGQN